MRVDTVTEQLPGGHAVCFYGDEQELVEVVCAELVAAERAGCAMVVIATPEHTAAFDRALAGSGLDLDALRGCGRLVSLDAAATLAALRPGGRFDPAGFRELIGGTLQAALATSGGRGIAAYGEMVALLWDEGEVLPAIELESLWNELGREIDFSLLCGYPQVSLGRPGDDGALREVCRLHDRLLGDEPPGREDPMPLHDDYPAEIDAPGRAREWTVEQLQSLGHEEELIERAAIVVTELASNAVLHAGTPFSLTLRRRGEALHISVEDGRELAPGEGRAGLVPRRARGLGLVDAVARSWGVAPRTGGKAVWAELG
jgi:anti-sigma regulatory factor (Ser/Thr protein kinase)